MARTRQPSRRQMVAGLLLASAASCLLWPRGADGPRRVLAPVLAPLSHGLTVASLNVRRNLAAWWGGRIDDETARRLLEEHEPLQRQLTKYMDRQLQRQVAAYEQLLAEQQRQLAEASGWSQALRDQFSCLLVPAKVIAAEPTPYQRTRTLGSRQSGVPGDYVTTRALLTNRPTAVPGDMPAVLAATALAGQIVSSGAWTAHMRLVSDPEFRINALVLRAFDAEHPRLIEDLGPEQAEPRRRILEKDDRPVPVNLTGCRDGLVSAAVPAGHAVAAGDLVVTMGDDERLPMAIVIGRVRSVARVADNPRHVTLRIEPEARLQTLQHVYIVLPRTREAAP